MGLFGYYLACVVNRVPGTLVCAGHGCPGSSVQGGLCRPHSPHIAPGTSSELHQCLLNEPMSDDPSTVPARPGGRPHQGSRDKVEKPESQVRAQTRKVRLTHRHTGTPTGFQLPARWCCPKFPPRPSLPRRPARKSGDQRFGPIARQHLQLLQR